LRRRLKKYFYAGQMARPPKLIGEIPKVTADWQWRNEWPITTDALMAGAWQIPSEKQTVLLFVNVSDDSLSTRVKFDPKEYGFSGTTFRVNRITPAGPQETFDVRAGEQPQVQFDPRSVFAWEFETAQSK
jgi:hypothetical protein